MFKQHAGQQMLYRGLVSTGAVGAFAPATIWQRVQCIHYGGEYPNCGPAIGKKFMIY